MIQKIKKYLYMSSAAIMLLMPAVTAGTIGVASAAAGCNAISQSVANGANSSLPDNGGSKDISCDSTGVGTDDLTKLAQKIITWFSIIVGAASIIMIIYGGFRYITSGGESGRVGAAKNSLLYAIVGLVIVALAQVIVHFVLNQTSQVGSP